MEIVGKKALIRRAIYGGKADKRDFRNNFCECMNHIDFESCPADTYVWMIPGMKAYGLEYYYHVLLYTDDTLVISENSNYILTFQYVP